MTTVNNTKFKVLVSDDNGDMDSFDVSPQLDGSWKFTWEDSGEPQYHIYSKASVEKHTNSGVWQIVYDEDKPDAVNSPKHYSVFDDIEAIEIIAKSMTKEMFKGYCFGNLLKYRLRAGNKDELQQEISKADKYKELYEKYKELCQ